MYKSQPKLQGPNFQHKVPENLSWNIKHLTSDPRVAVSFTFSLEKTKLKSKGQRTNIKCVIIFNEDKAAVSIIYYCGDGLFWISAHFNLSLEHCLYNLLLDTREKTYIYVYSSLCPIFH